MTKFNPFREAKKYLIIDPYDDAPAHMMYTVRDALEQVWYHTLNRSQARRAIQHVIAAVHPHHSERTWLTKTVLKGEAPVYQDMQDYRHRWLNYLAQQWDKGAIK